MTTNDRERKRTRKAKPTSSTIREFCARHDLARSTYFEWQRKGLGPSVYRVGRTVRITDEAEREWLEKARNGGFSTPQKEEAPSKERRKKKRIRRREDDQ